MVETQLTLVTSLPTEVLETWALPVLCTTRQTERTTGFTVTLTTVGETPCLLLASITPAREGNTLITINFGVLNFGDNIFGGINFGEISTIPLKSGH